jgi:hypothetical protein
VGSIRGSTAAGASLRIVPVDGSSQSIGNQADAAGKFEFPDVPAGWYILSSFALNFREAVTSVRVPVQGSVDAGSIRLQLLSSTPTPVRVLTVCDILENRDTFTLQRAVIVGIFKSGMDDTLRLDCPIQLVTGEVGWPSSIGLTGPAIPPDAMRDEVERKRAEVLKSGPPGAQPRPERVVALYGIFVAPLGLSATPCCRPLVETALPPARLFGTGEKDLRVIR